MTQPKNEVKFLLLSTAIIFALSAILINSIPAHGAGSSFSLALAFTGDKSIATDASSFIKTGKYKSDEPVIVKVMGSPTGNADLQYIGVAWVKIGDTTKAGNMWAGDGDDRCTKKGGECVKEIKLPGKASDYSGYDIIVTGSGIVDGVQTNPAILGTGRYSVPVSGANLEIAPPSTNVKPIASIKLDKSDLFEGDTVKVTIEASDPDRNLKFIKLDIPSFQSLGQQKECSSRERDKCKAEFKIPMLESGTFDMKATASDLQYVQSDESSITLTVKERLTLVKGELNIIPVQTANFLKWFKSEVLTSSSGKAYLLAIDGAYGCSYTNSRIAVQNIAGAWKTGLNFLYTIDDKDDALIVIYCSDQTVTNSNSYSYGGGSDED